MVHEVCLEIEDVHRMIGKKMGRVLHNMREMNMPKPYSILVKSAYEAIHKDADNGWPAGGLDVEAVRDDLFPKLRELNCPETLLGYIEHQLGFLETDLCLEPTNDQESFGNR